MNIITRYSLIRRALASCVCPPALRGVCAGPGAQGQPGVRGSGKRPAPSEKAYRDIYIPTQNYFSSPPAKRAVGVVKNLSLKNFKKPEKAWLIAGKNKLKS